jgi:MFS family permease
MCSVSNSLRSYLVDFSDKADPFNAMNVDIGFSEGQYGLLASVAFTSLFAVASLGAGIASDRSNRKVLTIASALTWSVATLGTAFSETYTQVIMCRILMGLACAFSTPTAYTLIRERAPKVRVALASSLYGTGVAVAGALSSLSILLDTEYGWRNTMLIVSVFGFVSAATSLVLLTDDPKVSSTNDALENESEEEQLSFVDNVQDIVSVRRVQWIFLGSFLRFCSGLCIGVWGAPYFRMVFPSQQSEYAVAQAGISAIGASLSGLLGGAAADWLVSNADENDGTDVVGRRLWVPVVGSLLAAPTWYFAVHSDGSFETAMLWLAAEYFVAECWFGPTISTLQSTVAAKVGGTAVSLFTLTGAVANLAPSLLGYMYGQASGGPEASDELSNLLTTGVCFGYVSSALCFGLAAQASPPTEAKIKVP